MTELSADRAKITPAHLARLAFVYVRQSSPRQVRCNRESQRRQYDFAAERRRGRTDLLDIALPGHRIRDPDRADEVDGHRRQRPSC